MYRLKKNVADFDIVDGPFAGRKFRAGELYAEVPRGYENKFEPARRAAEAEARAITPAEKNTRAARGRKGGK